MRLLFLRCLLPVADLHGGEPLIQSRERVYAYELYRQLRSRWPAWEYSLGEEVDKQGHPIARGEDLEGAKPPTHSCSRSILN